MSNVTETSQPSGERKRRRSRGGQNRNQNRNQDRNQNRNRNRNRNENRNHDNNDDRNSDQARSGRVRRRTPQPVKLTWWQKLLQVIGLYKAPEKPQARKTTTREPSVKAPKSNVRVAKTSPKEQESYEPKTRDDSYEPKSPRNNKRRRGGDPSTVESARVYVGNLSYDVTEQDLQELFKGVGTVRRSEIVYNRNTHRSKGYGFVEMIHKDDAMRAVEVLHDQPFMGRNMTVSGAKSKQQEDEDLEDNGPEIKAADIQLAPLPEPTPAAEQVTTDDAPVAEQAAAQSEAPQAEETPTAQQHAAASEEATQADAGKSEAEQRNFTLNS